MIERFLVLRGLITYRVFAAALYRVDVMVQVRHKRSWLF